MDDDRRRRPPDGRQGPAVPTVVWDPVQGAYREIEAPPAPPPDAPRQRQYFIGGDAVGKAPPPPLTNRADTDPPGGTAAAAGPARTTSARTTPAAPAPTSVGDGAGRSAAPGAPPLRPGQVFVPAPVVEPRAQGGPGADGPQRTAPAGPRPVVAHGAPAGSGPRPAPGPAGGSGGGAPPRAPRRRGGFGLPRPRIFKLRRALLLLPLVPLLVVVGLALYANNALGKMNRVAVGDTLRSGGGFTNILMVGSDDRADTGLEGVEGQRSDTLMVLHLGPDGDKLLSIPRDLIVTIAGTGQRSRINAAYNTDLGGGPQRLISTVTEALGIPVHRYMEVDFSTFGGLVDALGGITIDFPYPAYDHMSGLAIDTPGPHKLDGEMALAYVRSRTYTEVIDGRKRVDPTADLGRILRQQAFLRQVLSKVSDARNPITLARVGGRLAGGLSVDDKLGLTDAARMAWRLRGFDPEPVPLPTKVNNDNATLRLDDPLAQEALAQFR